MNRLSITIVCISLGLIPALVSGAIINVPADQPTIQEGITAASAGDTVLVADGTYSGENNRDIELEGKAITVMSATGAADCVIDCESLGCGFYLHQDEGLDTIILGFTIRNGGSIDADGGGILSTNGASATVTECIFLNNIADWGGGICIYGGGAECIMTITNCTFTGNSARWGGGIYCGTASEGVVIGGSAGAGNTFEGNFAGSGADIHRAGTGAGTLNANYNDFNGYYLSDYYVACSDAIDLSFCTSGITPITQDVYVSPAGDDSNDGLTEATAFRTIQYALSRVYGTETMPVTVLVGPGTYSPSATGEIFPIPVVEYVSMSGDSAANTILDAEETGQGMVCVFDDTLTIKDLTVTNGDFWYPGAGIDITTSTLSFFDCVISDNHSDYSGGGIWCRFDAGPQFYGCTISGNTTSGDSGGITLYSSSIPAVFTNCIITGNTADIDAGGIGIHSASGIFHNCLITDNTATDKVGGIGLEASSSITLTNSTITGNTANQSGGIGSDSSDGTVTDCIFWGNTPNEIVTSGSGDILVTYTDVQGGYTGEGNIDADPLFASGPGGNYYLSQTIAGQSGDSPCVGTGSDESANISTDINGADYCINLAMTRTDEIRDIGMVDMGYHYPSPFDDAVLGCQTHMPSTNFLFGDECFFDFYISNPSAETYAQVPVFAILDVFDTYFFAPGFTEDFDNYNMDIEPGMCVVEALPRFLWPDVGGSVSGILWYTAMTNTEITELFGALGTFEFGWGN